MQEVSGIYTSPFLYTDGLKMALRVRKVSGAFEKRAPGSMQNLFGSSRNLSFLTGGGTRDQPSKRLQRRPRTSIE